MLFLLMKRFIDRSLGAYFLGPPCMSGTSLAWVGEIRYLEIFIVRCRVFRCSLDYSKKLFLSFR